MILQRSSQIMTFTAAAIQTKVAFFFTNVSSCRWKYESFSTIAKGTIYVAYWLTAKAHEFCMNCSSDDICNNTFVVFQATPQI